MVLVQQMNADESPLALMRLRRADADVALRKSLVTASMLALTLAVAFLAARALLFAPAEFRIVPIPTDFFPTPHDPVAPPTPTGEYVAPPAVPPAVENSYVKPVDEVKDEPIVDTNVPIVHTGSTVGSATGEVRPGTGVGTSPPEVEKDPDPTTQFVDTLPDAVSRVIPTYPPIAREAGMEGKVMVRLLIGVDGRVQRAEIAKSSPMFDDAALTAARQWTFTPATTNAHPVKAWVWIPFDFRLH